MKYFEINEAPLDDYIIMPHERGYDINMKKGTIKKYKDPEIKKILRRKLEKINFDILIYIIPFENKIPGKFYDYYYEMDRKKIIDIFGENIEKKIKTLDQGLTIIFGPMPPNDFDNSNFTISSWGIIHDLIHGITIGNYDSDKLLSSVDTLISNIINPHDLEFSDIGTMKSASDGSLEERPEEFTTELFTQWVYTGKITFKVPSSKVHGGKRKAQKILNELNNIIPKIEDIFNKILNMSKGKIFYTSG